MNELAILLSGAMTTAPALPYETTYPGFHIITNSPGLVLTNGVLTWRPERRTGLPGTPREGEVLTTEEVNLRPCFAAVYPACPGHLHTNLTRWRWASGAWDRISETNSVSTNSVVWSGSSVTNFTRTDSIDWTLPATNITMKLSEGSRIRKALKELTDALEGQE